MNEKVENPLFKFNGIICFQKYDEPDWDAIILGPCINTPECDDDDEE